jgi:multiple sugar transport system substrate-binding protein
VRSDARRRWSAGVLVTAVVAGLAACSTEDPAEDPSAAPTSSPSGSASPTGDVAELTFGVYGSPPEVSGYRSMANTYNLEHDEAEIRVMAWSDRTEAVRAFRSGMDLPDIFMLPQRDLASFMDQDLVQPVDELLDERGVNFGDDYSRDALNAFAADDALQCMPWSIAPMVMYYNTDLIDFRRLADRGIDVPESPDRWSFEQFEAAVRFANRPRRGIHGAYVEPTIQGLAPYVYSGGGEVFDDRDEPTSTAFSSEGSQDALSRALPLLRDPQVTPSPEELDQTSALELFRSGRLATLAGYRSLVPELRSAVGLDFDVLPMPALDGRSTIASITGLCLSSDSVDSAAAADFLVHALSPEAVAKVVRAGYLQPANAEVAASDDFLQPGRRPASAAVFNQVLRYVEMSPMLDSWTRLEGAVDPRIEDMMTEPLLDLPAATGDIDAASKWVLDPEYTGPSEDAESDAP